MAALVVIIALVMLAVVVVVLAAPLRGARAPEVPQEAELQELEARREAKYREIRDAELDYRTGKLSREDHAAIDAALRAEAVEILDRLERLERLGAAYAAPREEPARGEACEGTASGEAAASGETTTPRGA